MHLHPPKPLHLSPKIHHPPSLLPPTPPPPTTPYQTLQTRHTPTNHPQMHLHRRPNPQLKPLPRNIPRPLHHPPHPIRPHRRRRHHHRPGPKQPHHRHPLPHRQPRPRQRPQRQHPHRRVKKHRTRRLRQQRRPLGDTVPPLAQGPVTRQGDALREQKNKEPDVGGDQ